MDTALDTALEMLKREMLQVVLLRSESGRVKARAWFGDREAEVVVSEGKPVSQGDISEAARNLTIELLGVRAK
jgi:hypothetical protein